MSRAYQDEEEEKYYDEENLSPHEDRLSQRDGEDCGTFSVPRG